MSKHHLNPDTWKHILTQVPNKNLGIFGYIKFEFIGNKHDVDPKHEKDFATWMKLTESYFYEKWKI